MEVVRTRDPLDPRIVTVYEPAAEEARAHVEVCVPPMLVGAQVVDTPAGLEVPVRATDPEKPPLTVRPIVEVAL
jgi:hypothetical protein